jgi:hypothetical protein
MNEDNLVIGKIELPDRSYPITQGQEGDRKPGRFGYSFKHSPGSITYFDCTHVVVDDGIVCVTGADGVEQKFDLVKLHKFRVSING